MKKRLGKAFLVEGIGFLCKKITILLLLLTTLQGYASVYSQTKLISVTKQKGTINEVLKELDRNSEFRFFYPTDLFDKNVELKIKEKEITMDVFLEKYLAPLGYEFQVTDKTVVIRKAPKPKQTKSKAAQPSKFIKIKGNVTGSDGAPLPGVTVIIAGSTKGSITDMDGNYDIEVERDGKLQFSFIGMQDQIVEVNNRTTINVVLQEKTEELEDITVVAFGKQKKESVLSSIETVKPAELKIPTSNLTTALSGRISGLISYQRSGEPGQDDASFFVRGVTSFSYAAGPLILIDGVEMAQSDLSRMQPDDIASFSIMKDAAATALYGARGANGVIMITTKEGREGKVQVNIRHEMSLSMPTDDIDLADPITYMYLNNEAVYTRNPLRPVPYSMEKIDKTIAGANPYVYPANDWHDMLFKNYTINSRTNFNMSGGGKVARYYIAGTYNKDNGILKVDDRNNFNNNINLKNYLLRSNINIDVTKSTEAVVRLYGTFKDYTGPLAGGSDMYSKVMRADPVSFPAYYEPDETYQHATHILFGNMYNADFINPYADMVKGYKEYSESKMQAQFELKQDLSMFVDGWSARALFSTNRYSFFDVKRSYKPYFYNVAYYNPAADEYILNPLNPASGTEWLNYDKGDKKISTTTYVEAATNYERTFNEKHGISGLLVFTMRNKLTPNAETLALSLPGRNMGLAGRFTYSYNSKYYTELNFGYNGSERFSKDKRWGFFPSMGLGYIISNEDFWNADLKKVVSKLKLKATYGLSGSDAIGKEEDRFFYLSEVNLDDKDKAYYWGENLDYYVKGVSVKRYPNEDITWETSKKLNVGVEVGLFNKLDVNVDVYHEHRTNILMERADIPPTMGLSAKPKTNVGEAKGKGIDLSVDFNHSFNKDFWVTARGNFTYAVSNFEVYEEVDNSETPWLSHYGHSTTQKWGYVAERLFIDEYDVANSPVQTFGEYGPGDIKYRDINGDGKITSLDKVPIGHPTRPEIVYGFGFSTGFKGFDLSCFFQGIANESFWIDAKKTAPFIDTDDDNKVISKNALLKAYADDHWSLDNRDNHALWPRLSDHEISNNTQTSTWFMRNGAFMRLKSLELGYTVPQHLIKHVGLSSARVYCSGTNLLTFSAFDLWDPEMAGNGLKYPIQKVFNFGVQVSF